MFRKAFLFVPLAILLIACSARETPPSVAEVAEETPASFNIATASGKVLPVQRATMSFEIGGRLAWIAAEGSEIKAGEELARLDNAEMDAAMAVAQARLASAEAQLRSAAAGARAEDLASAEATVEIAEAGVSAAELTVDQARDSGQLTVEAAQAALDQAQGALDVAQAELDRADSLFSDSDSRLVAAQAQVSITEAGVVGAEVSLEQARLSSAHNTAIAEAQLQVAQGQLHQARALRDALVAGPTADELAVLEAALAQAEGALAQAEAVQTKTILLAPFDGTVGAAYFHPGESILPAQPVLSLGDLTTLQVETTDFNEVDAIQVEIGSPATLTFDALPGIFIEGQVVQVAPMAASGQGGTNFTLIIEMLSPPPSLRWGMTAFVDVELE